MQSTDRFDALQGCSPADRHQANQRESGHTAIQPAEKAHGSQRVSADREPEVAFARYDRFPEPIARPSIQDSDERRHANSDKSFTTS